ncbi:MULTISPECIES: hypothetical protein [unclassified Tenacibaculum]|uniref:hypothetical protein n=1 Tax=unclassified Tenacibaculum TaxID=2635139 RepID=UPI001F1B8450|nr:MULTISPECIES: hypothetical protein [unclassified Tenacibaculum]MCF2874398.1 hypothetical protein [Tenacibaculum sp. Cn5-1]MCF2934979.1 hypothetical protein [Tenacibaculum sp. Cn5-34]MCG7511189.1 hypothetical protein [Tenacibaculum sp. Cn5-46]
MKIEELKKEIENLKSNSLSIGYNELTFATNENLADFQLGYSVDPEGESLIGEEEGDWNKDWVVISLDELGEPHFVDLKTEKVYTAMHGEGDWNPDLIAISVSKYFEIINFLKKLSKNRDNPSDLEENPISQNEIEEFEKLIEEINNGRVEFYEWENWVENE